MICYFGAALQATFIHSQACRLSINQRTAACSPALLKMRQSMIHARKAKGEVGGWMGWGGVGRRGQQGMLVVYTFTMYISTAPFISRM